MTTLTLAISRPAEVDLAEALAWYKQVRPGLENDLALCVEETLGRILRSPEAFPVVLADVRRAMIRRFPYGILFRARADRVEVLAVFHCRRDPSCWRRRAE